eukprot:1674711-Rhodomonas_salina.3
MAVRADARLLILLRTCALVLNTLHAIPASAAQKHRGEYLAAAERARLLVPHHVLSTLVAHGNMRARHQADCSPVTHAYANTRVRKDFKSRACHSNGWMMRPSACASMQTQHSPSCDPTKPGRLPSKPRFTFRRLSLANFRASEAVNDTLPRTPRKLFRQRHLAHCSLHFSHTSLATRSCTW